MHRTDAEIAQQQAMALAFFEQRFGLDPANGDVNISCELIDPQTGQRGIAQRVVAPPRDAGGGKVQVSIRNVITFPAY
jgi:hypothetical protein